MLHKFFIF